MSDSVPDEQEVVAPRSRRRAALVVVLFALSAVAVIAAAAAKVVIDARCYPADGTVTYQGQPLRKATVSFVPLSGDGAISTGVTNAEGQFSLTTDGQSGLPRGSYLVAVRAVVEIVDELADDESLPREERLRRMKAKIMKEPEMTQFRIPRRYASPQESGLTAEVKVFEENHFQFRLN